MGNIKKVTIHLSFIILLLPLICAYPITPTINPDNSLSIDNFNISLVTDNNIELNVSIDATTQAKIAGTFINGQMCSNLDSGIKPPSGFPPPISCKDITPDNTIVLNGTNYDWRINQDANSFQPDIDVSNGLNSVTYFVNKLSEEYCDNSFYLKSCTNKYLDFSAFMDKNGITNKTITPIYDSLSLIQEFLNWFRELFGYDYIPQVIGYEVVFTCDGNNTDCITNLDPSLIETYSSSTAGFFNQTSASNLGISLQINTSAMNGTGYYNLTTGDYKPFVFYNITSQYWNITLSIADTYSTRSGIVNQDNSINISNPNLISYWALDEATQSTTFVDSKAGTNNGSCSGTACPNVTTGISSKAELFDGINDLVTIPNEANFDFERTSNFTFSAWIKTSQTGFHRIFHKAACTSPYTGIWFGQYSDNTLYMELYDSTGAFIGRKTTQTINDGKWHNVIATYGGNSLKSGIKLYIDGINLDTTDSGTGVFGSNTILNNQNLLMGADTCPVYWNGTLDELSIYNKNISQSEVTQLYKSGLSQHANTNITLQYRTATSYNSTYGATNIWNLELNGTVIDNQDNSSFGKSGTWSQFTEGYNNNVYYKAVAGGSTAWWNFTVPTTGTYSVFTRCPYDSTFANNVPFIVYYGGGSNITLIDQSTTANSDRWQSLGTYSFNSGTTYNVTMNDSAQAAKNVCADAILIANSQYPPNFAGSYNFNYQGYPVGGAVGNGVTLPQVFNANSISDYLYIANANVSLLMTPNFTFSFWAESTTTASIPSFGFRDDTNNNNLMSFGSYASGLNFGSGSAYQIMTALPTAPVGKWQHYAITGNGTYYTIYINGAYNYSAAITVVPASATLRDFRIGASGFGYAYQTPFKGAFDEVAFYNRSLSPTEVLDLYNLGNTYINWNSDWSSASVINDGSGVISSTKGNYFQFKTNLYTNDTAVSPYLISHTINGITNLDTTAPNVTFNYQIPSDINSINLMGIDANISYNISDETALNTSSIFLYYKSNSTTRNTITFINGTGITGYLTKGYTYNDSSSFNFFLGDNEVYPGTYNLNQTLVELTAHNAQTLTSSNQYISTQLSNVTNTTQYNFLEVFTNSTSLINLYYCNSTADTSTGFNPLIVNYCGAITSIPAGQAFNHTDGNSSEQVVPFAINAATGKTTAGVQVTPTSYFLIRGNSGTVYYYTVPLVSRTSATALTINSGTTYTNQAYTVDLHLHQFSGNSSLYYYVCANDTSNNQNCSSVRSDLFDLGGLPPSAPTVYQPNGTTQEGGNIITNYTASISPNNYPIIYYNISLLNADLTFNQTVINNNSNNLGYIWTPPAGVYGTFIVRVTAYDSLGQSSSGYSVNFTRSADLTPPSLQILSPLTNIINDLVFNVIINATDLNGISRIWFNTNDTPQTNTTYILGTPITSYLTNGWHNITAWANDSYNNINQTSLVFFTGNVQSNQVCPPGNSTGNYSQVGSYPNGTIICSFNPFSSGVIGKNGTSYVVNYTIPPGSICSNGGINITGYLINDSGTFIQWSTPICNGLNGTSTTINTIIVKELNEESPYCVLGYGIRFT